MNDREYREAMCRQQHTAASAVIDQLKSQLERMGLLCHPAAASYHYRHWDDAIADDPWEGPYGMSYGFYALIRGFHAWCGFITPPPPDTSRDQSPDAAPDLVQLSVLEKPYSNWRGSFLPRYIPPEQRRYEVTFDDAAQHTLKQNGFRFITGTRQWEKTYPPAGPDVIQAVTDDVHLLIVLPNHLQRPTHEFINAHLNTLIFWAQRGTPPADLRYQPDSLQWLEAYLENQRKKKGGLDANTIETVVARCGVYLGECIRRSYGGEWVYVDGELAVQFSGSLAVFPLHAARKQFEHGLEESLLTLYRIVPQLMAQDLGAPAAAQQWFEKGMHSVQNGDVEQAILCFSRALAIHPQHVQSYHQRAFAHQTCRRLDCAIYDYTAALALDPHLANACYNRGLCHGLQSHFHQAIQDFDRVIELCPNNAGAYNNRGLAYRKAGQPQQALADFSQAIALDPDDALAYHNRGVTYAQCGDFAPAIRDLDTAAALDANDADVYLSRGLTYDRMGAVDAAVADFERYLARAPHAANQEAVRQRIALLKTALKPLRITPRREDA